MDSADVHLEAGSPGRLAVENERLQQALRTRLEESEALRRVEMLALGGRLTVTSAPGDGTTVRARVPLPTEPELRTIG